MDIPALLAKIAGTMLLAWTLWSILKSYRQQKQLQATTPQAAVPQQAISEMVLNNILLYLWRAFMVAFSIGLIFNN